MPTEAELAAMVGLVHPHQRGGFHALQKIERERIVELCLKARGNEIGQLLVDHLGVVIDQLRDMSHYRGHR